MRAAANIFNHSETKEHRNDRFKSTSALDFAKLKSGSPLRVQENFELQPEALSKTLKKSSINLGNSREKNYTSMNQL